MATLTIRQLDDEIYERLRIRAQANNRSLEAEARQILSEHSVDTRAIVGQLRAFHERMVAKHGYLPDSTPLIRRMRAEESSSSMPASRRNGFCGKPTPYTRWTFWRRMRMPSARPIFS